MYRAWDRCRPRLRSSRWMSWSLSPSSSRSLRRNGIPERASNNARTSAEPLHRPILAGITARPLNPLWIIRLCAWSERLSGPGMDEPCTKSLVCSPVCSPESRVRVSVGWCVIGIWRLGWVCRGSTGSATWCGCCGSGSTTEQWCSCIRGIWGGTGASAGSRPRRRPGRGAGTARPWRSGCWTTPSCCGWRSRQSSQHDEELAQQLVDDLSEPERGVLIEGKVYVEAPLGSLVQDLLIKDGWELDEPWIPLRRDLARAGAGPGLADRGGRAGAGVRADRDPAGVVRRVHLHRRALARDGGRSGVRRRAVPDRPQRAGRGGRRRDRLVRRARQARADRADGRASGPPRSRLRTAITVAAARALRELGSSSAVVCTPAFNVGAVATYQAAGFEPPARDPGRVPDEA